MDGCLLGRVTRLVCIFGCAENYGVDAVQPAATDSPPDCRIYFFEPLIIIQKKRFYNKCWGQAMSLAPKS